MRFLALLLVILAFPGLASVTAAPVKVENFALIDHRGKFHEFDYYRRDPNVKGIVLFTQGNGCPLVRKRIPELKRLRSEFQSQGILFGMINANPQDERDDLSEEAAKFEIDFPILKDSTQLVASMLEVDRTGEALLIDTKSRKIIFRGPIDDKMSYQSEKKTASKHYLSEAITAFLKGGEIAEPVVEAPGCRIKFNTPKKDSISYSETVAAILKDRCVSCHTKGGVGPFAMSNHKKVSGWSDMIAEVILTKQMPPWHADPQHGAFANHSGLTDEETQSIVQWVRAGSPRGEGPDPLDGYQPEQPEWKLGKPDHVIDLPKQEIPAEGVLKYRYVHIDSPFDRDVWVRAAEVNPGNKQVLHHTIITIQDQKSPKKRDIKGHWLTGYAPGTDPLPYPEGSGVLIRKGDRLNLELHYTVSGRPEIDLSRIGLYLMDEPPAKVLETGIVAHHRFKIPPHAREYAQSAVKKIPIDITLYSMNPHMHFRGKRMRFTLKKPDNSTQVLLSVPNYNFNWQRSYYLEKPLEIASGSQLIIDNAWDNSSLNPFNPDPKKTVGWGSQTFDEMFFATFTYIRR